MCNLSCDYSEQVILTLLIKGLEDTELQQDILAEANITLTRAVQLATARRRPSRRVGSAAAISTYKKEQRRTSTHGKDECRNCGQKSHKE